MTCLVIYPCDNGIFKRASLSYQLEQDSSSRFETLFVFQGVKVNIGPGKLLHEIVAKDKTVSI